MKVLFVFPILLGLLIPYQTVNSPDASSPLTVANYKWSRARRAIETPVNEGTVPARAMIPQNRRLKQVTNGYCANNGCRAGAKGCKAN